MLFICAGCIYSKSTLMRVYLLEDEIGYDSLNQPLRFDKNSVTPECNTLIAEVEFMSGAGSHKESITDHGFFWKLQEPATFSARAICAWREGNYCLLR